jgi:hypothetical protein
MNKKVYIRIGVLLAILLGAGVYVWRSYYYETPAPISQFEKESAFEEEALKQDVNDLENLEKDNSLDNLDLDLITLAGEKAVIEIASVDNLASELSAELDSFSIDLIDLDAFRGDVSLDILEEGLSSI